MQVTYLPDVIMSNTIPIVRQKIDKGFIGKPLSGDFSYNKVFITNLIAGYSLGRLKICY